VIRAGQVRTHCGDLSRGAVPSRADDEKTHGRSCTYKRDATIRNCRVGNNVIRWHVGSAERQPKRIEKRSRKNVALRKRNVLVPAGPSVLELLEAVRMRITGVISRTRNNFVGLLNRV